MDQPGDQGTDDHKKRNLRTDGIGRTDEMVAREHLLQGLGMDFDAWNGRVQRRRSQIEKSGRGGAEDDMPAP